MSADNISVRRPLQDMDAVAQRFQAQAHTEHLFEYFDVLESVEKQKLIADIIKAEPDAMAELFRQASEAPAKSTEYEFEPPRAVSAGRMEQNVATDVVTEEEKCVVARLADMPRSVVDRWRNRGLRLLATGSVGALILAGGQGTRLGSSQPKGMYPIGAISKKSFFQLFVERINKLRSLASKVTHTRGSLPSIPIYVMTSEENWQDTTRFFADHDYFGFPQKDLIFFSQDSFPCLSKEGKLLLSTRSSLARSPNGNGSVFSSMAKPNGALDDMKSRGLIGFHVVGIDNVLSKILDPVFIGYVDEMGADVGNKVIPKLDPDEKIGVMCTRRAVSQDPSVAKKNERSCCVVEYSELPADMRLSRDPDGNLTFRAGNICSHYFRVDFIQRVLNCPNISKRLLTAHFAYKKIPVVDPSNPESSVTPTTENGIKLEYFIFDYFLFANRVAGLECVTASEFACVKNATGNDSPDSCRAAMSALYKSWLEAANGSSFSGDGHLEISPSRSYEGEDLDNVSVSLPAYLDCESSEATS